MSGCAPGQPSVVVCVDVADPDALQAGDDGVRSRAVAPAQLPVGPLPAVQQQAPPRKHVQVRRRHVPVARA